MNDYTPNSHRFKEEQKNGPTTEKKVEKAITGSAKVKKKNEICKFRDIFVAEDLSNVKNYIFMDVLVPAVRKAVSDIVRDGIDMILYGKAGSSRPRTSTASYVDYSKSVSASSSTSVNTKMNYTFDEVILTNRGEAEEVLSRMDELIETYGVVSVADLYDLCGITGNYTDNRYGWTSIKTAEVVRVKEGYLLKFPKAMAIN